MHFTGVKATIQFDNYTSILYILTPLIVDGTNLTCKGEAITRGIDKDYIEHPGSTEYILYKSFTPVVSVNQLISVPRFTSQV